MTNQEKLQSLFDAALRDSSEIKPTPPKQAFPTSTVHATAIPAREPVARPQAMAAGPMPVSQVSETEIPATEIVATPQYFGALDDAASTELAAILDERHARQKRRRRISSMITALVLSQPLAVVRHGS